METPGPHAATLRVVRLVTPHGEASISARWKRARLLLVAIGSEAALRWMFPKARGFELVSGGKFRHVFTPHKEPISDIATLERIRAAYVRHWHKRLTMEQPSDGLLPGAVPLPFAPPNADDRPTSVQQLGERFMAAQRGSVAASTMEKYILHLRRWQEELGADFAFTGLTTERVLLARQSLVKRLNPRTVNGSMQTLRRVLAFAIDMGWVGVIPWRKVKPLTEAEFKPRWWTPDQAAVALQIAGKDRHQPTALLMLVLGVMVGLRKDEAVNLRWQDLALDRVDSSTRKPAPVCHIRCDEGWKPKGRRPRDIPVSDQCLELLLPHRRESGYVLTPERVLPKRGGTKRVYRWDPDKVWDRVLAVAMQQGLPEIRFHDLRHSFASNLLGAGVSAEKVAEWLGHKDTRLVHSTYGHLLSYDADINRVDYRLPLPAPPT